MRKGIVLGLLLIAGSLLAQDHELARGPLLGLPEDAVVDPAHGVDHDATAQEGREQQDRPVLGGQLEQRWSPLPCHQGRG